MPGGAAFTAGLTGSQSLGPAENPVDLEVTNPQANRIVDAGAFPHRMTSLAHTGAQGVVPVYFMATRHLLHPEVPGTINDGTYMPMGQPSNTSLRYTMGGRP